jgi:hypothetical protein
MKFTISIPTIVTLALTAVLLAVAPSASAAPLVSLKDNVTVLRTQSITVPGTTTPGIKTLFKAFATKYPMNMTAKPLKQLLSSNAEYDCTVEFDAKHGNMSSVARNGVNCNMAKWYYSHLTAILNQFAMIVGTKTIDKSKISRYALYDVDGDGMEELFVTSDEMRLTVMYAAGTGGARHICFADSKGEMTIHDNFIVTRTGGGEGGEFTDYHEIVGSVKATPSLSVNTCYFDHGKRLNKPVVTYSKPFDKAAANAVIKRVPRESKSLKDLDWQPFSQIGNF